MTRYDVTTVTRHINRKLQYPKKCYSTCAHTGDQCRKSIFTCSAGDFEETTAAIQLHMQTTYVKLYNSGKGSNPQILNRILIKALCCIKKYNYTACTGIELAPSDLDITLDCWIG